MGLWHLWYLSLALAAAAVVVMLLLVLRRVVQLRMAGHRERLRSAAAAVLFDYLDGNATAAHVRAAAGGRSDIVGNLIVEMREILRGEGIERLVELAISSGGLAAERRQLRRRNPGARVEAVRRLGIYGRGAVPVLQTALDDSSAAVRTVAAVELTALDAAPPLAPLAERMRIGIDAYSEDLRRIFRRAVAAEPRVAIGLLEDEWTIEALRLLLIDGLGYAGEFSALPALSAMTQHEASDVRAEALRALANLGHPSAGSVAIEALADADWRVRAQAANCARRIGASDAVSSLEALLHDEQWWVRFRAAEALSTLGDDGRSRLSRAVSLGDRAGQVAQLVLAERGLA